MRKRNELTAKDLKDVCNPNMFKFETTKELEDTADLIYGQERGIKALQFGIDIDVKLLQYSNTESSISFNELEISTFAKFVHFANAPGPILVTEFGIWIDVNPSHSIKASGDIDTVPSVMLIDDSWGFVVLHSYKTLFI